MKTQRILCLLVCILFCIFTAAVSEAQGSSPVPVNDTIGITPFIPVTANILANDTIPTGDSVSIVLLNSVSYFLKSTINAGGNVTFVLNHWGYSGYQYKKYLIMDYTQGTVSDTALIVFRVHDESFGYLDINNVKARINSSGLHFFDENAEYEVPKGSGKTSLFANSIWIGGYDANNALHFAGERYRQGPTGSNSWSKQDYFAGPVSDSAAYSIYQDTIWNYIWKINRSEIEYHRNHYWENGYVAVKSILTWPVSGNMVLGQAEKLAPFSDRNGNGIYEPYDGDYPEIRGDQALFFIYNDDHGPHQESWGEKLKVEIHGMVYAFDRPNDTAFKNTVFLHCKIINRSQNTYTRTIIGVFADIDLGYWADDYIGCDPERGMFYGYNGYPVDGAGQPNAYGANPPMQAVVILGGPTMDADGYDNPSFKGTTVNGPSFKGSCDLVILDSTIIRMKYGAGEQDSALFMVRSEAINGMNFGDGIADNERYGMSRFIYNYNDIPGWPFFDDPYPAYASEYYASMMGHMCDSTTLVYGGNGHLLAGGYGPECKFMFPGLNDRCDWGTNGQPPNGPKEWTENTALNFPFDRTGVASSGPFTFGPGAVQEMDVAFAWARNYHSMDSTLAKLNAVVDTIRRHFGENNAPGGGPFYGINEPDTKHSPGLKVYPNPAKELLFIEIPGQNNEVTEISLISIQGITVLSETNACQPIARVNVSNTLPGFYLLRVKSGTNIWMDKVIISR